MPAASTLVSTLSCVLTSVFYFRSGFKGERLVDQLIEKSAEKAEKLAEGSHARSCICRCAAADPTPLVVGGTILGICILVIGIWLGRRCASRAPPAKALSGPAAFSKLGLPAIPDSAPVVPPRKGRRIITPSSSLSSSSAE